MKTSDKEIDDLFNSKLNNLEIEPSASLWENIAAELDHKPKKKSIMPKLRMAAGIIVILSAGLFLLRKNEPVKNQLPKKLVKVELKKQNPAIKQLENLVDKKSMLLLSAKNRMVKEASATKNRNKAVFAKPLNRSKFAIENASTQMLAQNKPETSQQELPDNQTAQAKITVVPDAAVSLKPQPEIETAAKPLVKTSVLAAADTRTEKVKRKRIRSIGDVVNLVMAKVDKREDKLIQFSDNDDGDESNVTGINLGIINLKKENK